MSPIPTFNLNRGFPKPFGVTSMGQKTNFAIFYPSESVPTLCLYRRGENQSFFEVAFDAKLNRTGDVWHILIENLPPELCYDYRINPANDPELAEHDKGPLWLLDPYAKAVLSHKQWNIDDTGLGYRPFGAILKKSQFDWEGDVPLNLPIEDLIIYEMHVRAFTEDPSSAVSFPGTFKGLQEKIDYLKHLGINAIELLPIHEFNEMEYPRKDPLNGKKLCNFWGYSTVNFFSLMSRYSSKESPEAAIDEFKSLVKELHKNGIEVILDVVFNHTAEGNEKGPILSFKGLSKSTYYILQHNRSYENYTGCGNTLNCNHPYVIEMIISSLRYWVSEMHVDGFRFDLASIFSRDSTGIPLADAPIIKAISEDPILAKTKLIAEPWDAVGLYQVGNFYGSKVRWCEWNDRYRDTVRKFIKGTPGVKEEFATRLCGSQDLYHNRNSRSSINFITSHDGFSLADLVSYNHKHNLKNCENNTDGNSFNDSWNCGIEGTTQNNQILSLRLRQMRNFHLANMMSQGVPMITMGDEYGHSKNGNNNTWCQDNQLNWFLWDKLQNNGFARFFRLLIAFRKNHSAFKSVTFLTDQDVTWHSLDYGPPVWDLQNHYIALTLKDPSENHNDLFLAFNSRDQEVIVQLPTSTSGNGWHWMVDTANMAPDDFIEGNSRPVNTSSFKMQPYSAILLQKIS